MVFHLNCLGKKIGFRLIGLGNFFIPISPRYAKKVQATPASIMKGFRVGAEQSEAPKSLE